jgi:membrane protease YdiL (CAAX protease family)
VDKAFPWWRIGLVFAWVTVATFALFHGANAIFGTEYDRWAHVARACAMFLLVVPMVVLVTRLLDRVPLSGIGLTSLQRGGRDLLTGAACWLVPAAAGTGVLLLFGQAGIGVRGSMGELLLNAASLVVLVLIFEAVPEELVFRGYLMSGLSARLGPRPATWAQAVLFTLWGTINGGDTSPARSALFFAFGVTLGLLRSATGGIWAPIGFHLAFQTLAQLFGTVGGQIELSSPGLITIVAFGALPFAAAAGVSLRMLRKRHTSGPGDRSPEPDGGTPHGAAGQDVVPVTEPPDLVTE